MSSARQHVRDLLGDNGVAVLPSAASLAPRRDANPATVDVVRLRTMAITCIAGLAGLPQVSLPLLTPDGEPLGVLPNLTDEPAVVEIQPGALSVIC